MIERLTVERRHISLPAQTECPDYLGERLMKIVFAFSIYTLVT